MPDEFEAMAEACIANHEQVIRHGSIGMQAVSRILLYALGVEIARRIEDEDSLARNEESRPRR
ncbi:hypothetical protein [Methylobacterium sp. J-077]|uniref:hypothetical protein n=1 Tax=Methylobacterium sp. J-077 TaxID=2836656 RepID=UPI001FBA424D|nr:hypothetical protein [Methylobacterium sp. J-077]MCJ2121763.1 hypothetical protein [Methylobacterium sp. J-077]